MDALTFLSGCAPLFAGVPEEALTPLAVDSTLRQIAAGQSVLRAGMTVEFLHAIVTGSVEVHAKFPGKSKARVAVLGPGEVFGETSILEMSLADATVKAGAAGALVLAIPEAPFRRLVEENETVASRLRALISSRRPPPSRPASA